MPEPKQPLMTRDDLLAMSPVEPDARRSYGPHPDQVVDIHLPLRPDDGPAPVALLLHGGCWRATFGRSYFGPFAQALGRHGFAAWNVEYRRLGSGGGWPATFEDVAAAADLLAESAPDFGFDLDRVVAVGHSAGGHLASWLAARGHLPSGTPGARAEPLAVRGVLALAGIPDLMDAHRRGICKGAVAELVGGEPSDRSAVVAVASPAELPPTPAPQVHMVGEFDAIVPPAYVRACVERLRANGQSIQLSVLPGSGHMEPVVASARPWTDVLGAIAALSEGRMSATRATESPRESSRKGTSP